MGRAFEYRRAAKEKRWGTMSRVFPRLAKSITIAAKEGGSDPAMNPKLRTAIMSAKAQNMPKANIDAAIKRATSKDVENFAEIVYEGKGPHGVLVVVECATDNNTRTVANVKSYFNKAGGSLAPSGSFEYMFSRKAVFQIKKTENINIEELEFNLIDAGLESIETEEDMYVIYADFKDFGNLAKALEDSGVELLKAELQRIPNDVQEFTEEQLADIDKLIDKLEEDDDVQAVFTNIA
ncbi:MAG: YebC/PmpR family DNA-binding transcriptional regulator [Bacteroidales bacterium]|nr:YebC/PmpR family DNA-binding transcriptional regulator [Bacteroidales bacterium]